MGLTVRCGSSTCSYLGEIARFDLGTSQFTFSKSNNQLLAETLGWTIGLTFFSAIVAFLIGTGMGAIMEWKRQNTGLLGGDGTVPNDVRSAVFHIRVGVAHDVSGSVGSKRLTGSCSHRMERMTRRWRSGRTGLISGSWVLRFGTPLCRHCRLCLVSLGGWAMGNARDDGDDEGRGLHVAGEAKGLPDNVRFYKYAIRNSLLPQLTGLALQIG